MRSNKKMRMDIKKYILCKSLLSKAKGLMFSRPKNLVFEFDKPRLVSLHTFFVFFPIDVFFLDEKKKIVEKTRMRPFSFYLPNNKAKYVVEIASKTKVR
jgi:uncharacterized membrane protein (UPF0127 family)